MPPILMAFFILIGAMTVPPAVEGLLAGKDKNTRPKWGKPTSQEYRTWTDRPWIAVANQDTRRCDVTFFASATRNRVTRLRVGGVEQQIDYSWSLERSLKIGERRTIAFEFLDPVGGARLACNEQALTCYGETEAEPDTEVREGRCLSDAVTPKRKGGRQAFIGYTKPLAMFDATVGGAYMDVTFEITGDVSEAWYCPALVVTWPDGSPSRRESDCPPYEERDKEAMLKWTFNHGFPGGTWAVTACIEKSGKTLACTSVPVRVIGNGE